MRPRFLLTSALALGLCAASPAQAMTKEEAANNLMLLTGARNEALFCEPFGKTAMKSLMAWETRHKAVFDRSTKTVEDAAVATGGITREKAPEASMMLMARLQARDDRELAPTRTQRACTRYDESLAIYGSKLVTK